VQVYKSVVGHRKYTETMELMSNYLEHDTSERLASRRPGTLEVSSFMIYPLDILHVFFLLLYIEYEAQVDHLYILPIVSYTLSCLDNSHLWRHLHSLLTRLPFNHQNSIP
jgi:hypothetical protein